ncbi:MAG: LamB/YcsF family protein [Actinomycetota bacterium]|nr:LamB/YcsF family protein [Actinomycetota bacterium]
MAETVQSLDALDVNVDLGESFGRWKLGDDLGIMPHITSVSIACGFHAGDPATMRETANAAVEHGLQIGAHVALPDLLGFGRRRMSIAPDDLRDYTTYQIGALQAFVTAAGGRLSHVKPHGALYAMCSATPELAAAVAQAMVAIDPALLLLLLDDNTAEAVQAQGIRLVTEAFVDLEYHPDGTLVIEAVKRMWDPERVAARTLRLVRERLIDAEDGSDLATDAPTVCIHGDGPNAVEIAATVQCRLAEAGVRLAPLIETLPTTTGGRA